MQTFITSFFFSDTARDLDMRRLGKQRIEARDILYLCLRHQGYDLRKDFNKSNEQSEYLWKRYRNHPAVKMWINHESWLVKYIRNICIEWKNRGYEDNTLALIEFVYEKNKNKFRKGFGNKKNILSCALRAELDIRLKGV